MFKIIVLVCALGVPHDKCTLDTAVDVIHSRKVASIFTCGFGGEAQMASTVLADPKTQYVKIVCLRTADKS